jgi:hypothetical protein
MRLLAVISVAFGLAGTHPAEACSCLGPQTLVLPAGSAPTNTHVFVWWSAHGDRKHAVELRVAGSKTAIAVDTKEHLGGDYTVVEVIPRAALRGNIDYHVVDTGGRELARFKTTGGPNREPLQWHGVATAGAERYARGGGGSCISRRTYAKLVMAESDPPPPAGTRRIYAVWVADKSGKLDYKKPPATYTVDDADDLVLGSGSICRPDNMRFPDVATIKLGIKIVDTAGNSSPPSEVTIDLANAHVIP